MTLLLTGRFHNGESRGRPAVAIPKLDASPQQSRPETTAIYALDGENFTPLDLGPDGRFKFWGECELMMLATVFS